MKIWVDADATPRAVKEMLYRAAERTGIELVLVANQYLRIPTAENISLVVVGQDFDAADDYIAKEVQAGELVITQDIPLAAAVVEKGAIALENRGDIIDESNARSRLQMRDLLETIRMSGEQIGGPKPYSDRDKRRFAGELDRWLNSLRTS